MNRKCFEEDFRIHGETFWFPSPCIRRTARFLLVIWMTLSYPRTTKETYWTMIVESQMQHLEWDLWTLWWDLFWEIQILRVALWSYSLHWEYIGPVVIPILRINTEFIPLWGFSGLRYNWFLALQWQIRSGLSWTPTSTVPMPWGSWMAWKSLPGRRDLRWPEQFSMLPKVLCGLPQGPLVSLPVMLPSQMCGIAWPAVPYVFRNFWGVQLRGWGAILDALQHLSAPGGGHVQCLGGAPQHGNRVSTSAWRAWVGKARKGKGDRTGRLTDFEKVKWAIWGWGSDSRLCFD